MGGGYRGSVRALRGWRAPDWKSGALKRVVFDRCGFNTRMEAIEAHGAPRSRVGFVGCGLRPVAYVPDALSGR